MVVVPFSGNKGFNLLKRKLYCCFHDVLEEMLNCGLELHSPEGVDTVLEK